MTDRIGGIPYDQEKDGDLRFFIESLIKNPERNNTYRGRAINEVLRMLLRDKFKEKLKEGELKSLVKFCAEKLNLPQKKCIDLIYNGEVSKKITEEWLKSTQE